MKRYEMAAQLYIKNIYPGASDVAASMFANDCLAAADYFFDELNRLCNHVDRVNGICVFCGLEQLVSEK